MAVILHSGCGRPAPTPDDLKRSLELPLIQMVVCGRSGSMLVQALLDGNAQVLQIPHTFKFYDFVAAWTLFVGMTPDEVAKTFVEHAAHAALFDSEQSVLLRARLGEDMGTRVVFDRQAFAAAMARLLEGGPCSPRRVLYAAVLAYAWCAGRDLSRAKVIFMHLHHGDWHWPRILVEDCNIRVQGTMDWYDVLPPDGVVVSIRNPADQIASYKNFVLRALQTTEERRSWYERYLRLLIQDWRRIALYAAVGVPFCTVQLEHLRLDKDSTMERLLGWMGLEPDPQAAAEPTIHGLPWWGDIYMQPTRVLNPPMPVARPSASDADAVFLYAGAPGAAAAQGYPDLPLIALLNRLAQSSLWPKPARGWPYEAAQWKADKVSRRAFLTEIEARQNAVRQTFVAGRPTLAGVVQ